MLNSMIIKINQKTRIFFFNLKGTNSLKNICILYQMEIKARYTEE